MHFSKGQKVQQALLILTALWSSAFSRWGCTLLTLGLAFSPAAPILHPSCSMKLGACLLPLRAIEDHLSAVCLPRLVFCSYRTERSWAEKTQLPRKVPRRAKVGVWLPAEKDIETGLQKQPEDGLCRGKSWATKKSKPGERQSFLLNVYPQQLILQERKWHKILHKRA